ncbi:TIGR02285 family protein [Chromobacterium sp. IIBBL 290-4]|uniref:TIGR02285 family protein n=1 Tax=Chromobacterium sp. IIBBL 290-4 TaxID=2953890 RepID=UPI0020B67FCD|nr:TIGR02285 family protein [Chromobacterium sp. IIBBL 290-4]UTH73782.1 TIGR02285 family protein [Chromobacterium sp. IIBBL 290-4]
MENLLKKMCWLAALLLAVRAGAVEVDTKNITWVLSDWPPNFIVVNGLPTVGQNDVYLKLLMARWPEARHRFEVMSTARSILALQKGSQVCRPNLIPTPERERFAYFTLTHLQMPLRVIIRSDKAAMAPRDARGDVLLGKLIAQPALRGIAAAGRSYTAEIDKLLAGPRNANVKMQPNLPSNEGLFKLLELGRADYTLDYEPNFNYRAEQVLQAGLTNLPLAGSKLIPVGIACPRTPWGRQAIVKIDSLLAEAVKDPAYREAQTRWLSTATMSRYKAELDRFYRWRTHPAPPGEYPPP